jgi:hypothetical protein
MTEMIELDARIAEAEQRLVDRQARFMQHVAQLRFRAAAAARPARAALPVVGLVIGALVLWRLRPGSRRGRHAAPERARLPLARLAGLAWPLLPQRWRAALPATVTRAAALVVPMLWQRLVRHRR